MKKISIIVGLVAAIITGCGVESIPSHPHGTIIPTNTFVVVHVGEDYVIAETTDNLKPQFRVVRAYSHEHLTNGQLVKIEFQLQHRLYTEAAVTNAKAYAAFR